MGQPFDRLIETTDDISYDPWAWAVLGSAPTPPPPAPTPNKYARMLAALLPPGKVWRLIGDSLLSQLLAGCADELGRLDARTTDLLNEADPTTAVELLPEYEAELALASTGTNAERQARVVARTVARQRFRPADILAALAPLLGTDTVIVERTNSLAVAMGDVREIFHFFVLRDPSSPGTYYLDSAQALLNQIKPSHTIGTVIETENFLCDDPHSLCDRDPIGV